MRLSQADCRRLFSSAARVVLAVNGEAGDVPGEQRPPLAVPITCALLREGGRELAVFAVDHKPKSTGRLRRLRLIEAAAQVCLLADHYEQDWARLWWVRADGHARLLEPEDGGAGRRAALDALVARYPQYQEVEPAGTVVQIAVRRWVGWAARPADVLTG